MTFEEFYELTVDGLRVANVSRDPLEQWEITLGECVPPEALAEKVRQAEVVGVCVKDGTLTVMIGAGDDG